MSYYGTDAALSLFGRKQYECGATLVASEIAQPQESNLSRIIS